MKTPNTAAITAAVNGGCGPQHFRIRPSILLFGDSITQFGYGRIESDYIGWISLLSGAYTRRCDVLNRGFSGYTSRDALQLVPRIFGSIPTRPPSSTNNNNSNDRQLLFCTIFFGANDATIPGFDQHVPIDEYATNINQIITSIRQSTASNENDSNNNNNFPIILITPPPIDEKAWAECRSLEKSNRTNERARQYGLKLYDIAKNHKNCDVVDAWELLQGACTSEIRGQHLYDGLHLNQSGNRLLFHGLISKIEQQYPHLAPMNDDDGDGKYGKVGIPIEEKLWTEFYES